MISPLTPKSSSTPSSTPALPSSTSSASSAAGPSRRGSQQQHDRRKLIAVSGCAAEDAAVRASRAGGLHLRHRLGDLIDRHAAIGARRLAAAGPRRRLRLRRRPHRRTGDRHGRRRWRRRFSPLLLDVEGRPVERLVGAIGLVIVAVVVVLLGFLRRGRRRGRAARRSGDPAARGGDRFAAEARLDALAGAAHGDRPEPVVEVVRLDRGTAALQQAAQREAEPAVVEHAAAPSTRRSRLARATRIQWWTTASGMKRGASSSSSPSSSSSSKASSSGRPRAGVTLTRAAPPPARQPTA